MVVGLTFFCKASDPSAEEKAVGQPLSAVDADFQRLLDTILPIVDRALKEQGTFDAVAAALTGDGKTVVITSGTQSKEAIPVLSDVMRSTLHSLARDADARALALCIHVELEPGKGADDALGIVLEHVDGSMKTVGVPYTRSRDGEIDYGDLIFLPMKSPLFPED